MILATSNFFGQKDNKNDFTVTKVSQFVGEST